MEKVFNDQIVEILRENMSSCKFDPSLYEKGETYIIRRAPTTLKTIPEVEVPNNEAPRSLSESMAAQDSLEAMSLGSSNFGFNECSDYNSKSQVLFGKFLSSDITATTKTCPALLSESCEAVTSLELDVARNNSIRRDLEARRCTVTDQEGSDKTVIGNEIAIGDHELKCKGLSCIAEYGLFDAFNEDGCNSRALKQVIKEVIKEYDSDQSRRTCTCCRRGRGLVFWPFPDEPVLALLDKVLSLFGFGSDVDMEF